MMLARPLELEPDDGAPTLPLLVMTSSLLDLVLRPTTSPIDVKSIYIIEEAFAAFLAMSLGDQFDGSDGSANLEEVDVVVKALRFDGLYRRRSLSEDLRGANVIESSPSEAPSTILTTSVRAKLRGLPGSISYQPDYFNDLVFAAFTDAKEGGKLQDILSTSSHPILNSVTDTEIVATSFAAFATGQASFAPNLPGTGAAVIGDNEISPGIIYSETKEDRSPAPSSSGPTFDRSDPLDLAFVGMSGLIFFAMIILIYLHRVKDRGPSHEERIRQFFAADTDRSRATREADFNDSSSDEGPINGTHFASEGSGMLEGRSVQPKILSSTQQVPTLAKYHYPVPKLRPRPQTKNRSTYTRSLGVSAFLIHDSAAGLNPIPEDQAFASPSYFDPEDLRRSDSSLSSDVFGVDVSLCQDGDADGLSSEQSEKSSNEDQVNDTAQGNATSSSKSRWNHWLQQVMVVKSGMRGDIREDDDADGDADADEYAADAEDINVGTVSSSYSSDSGGGEGVSQLSTGYSC